MTMERAKCPECERVLPVQPSLGGDGSYDVYPRHDYPGSKDRCEMSRMEVDQSEYLEPQHFGEGGER